MTDSETWTQKFDRWWAENGRHLAAARGVSRVTLWARNSAIKDMALVAFLAGAAAERAHRYVDDAIEKLRADRPAAERTEHAASRLQPCPDCGQLVPPGDFHQGTRVQGTRVQGIVDPLTGEWHP